MRSVLRGKPESMNNSTQSKRIILAVDHDPDVRATVRHALEREAHRVVEAHDGKSALHLAQQHRPDLIILDAGLPDINGFELCALLRSMPFVNDTPIMFLGGHHNGQTVARALDSGGDDYLRKPFAARELTARVRALLRRTVMRPPAQTATLYFVPDRSEVVVDGRHVTLTRTEYALLEFLCQRPTEYYPALTLLEHLWGYPPDGGDTALVRNHIHNLRRKIEPDPDHPTIIMSAHGRGYSVNARVAFQDNAPAR